MELTEFEKKLQSGEWVGIVEDNADPDLKQRCRIRIPYLHGDNNAIPTENLPWSQPKRDNNGLTFSIPDKNKIVNVTFPTGNLYYPVYNNAQHLNINLQKKIETYSGDDYTNFIALCYNTNAQIYIDNQKGLLIQYKEQQINIHQNGMAFNLEDNSSKMVIGTKNADQELMLGTNFMHFFDTLMSTLQDAYIGNNGAPCIANPNFINVYSQYQSMRKSFLSKHIYAADNDSIESNNITTEEQVGDNYTLNNVSPTLNVVQQPLNPVDQQYIMTSTNSTVPQKRQELGGHIDEELQNNDKNTPVETVNSPSTVSTAPITSVNKPVPDKNISVYVAYSDATRSETAIANKIDNTPDTNTLTSMKHVASNIFDPCYEYMLKKYGIKIKVNSFFRHPNVDYQVQLQAYNAGRSKKVPTLGHSQHCRGEAIDINAGKYNTELFYYIKNNIKYDQMLWEFGTKNAPNWVHVSLTKGSNRNQVARIETGGNFIHPFDYTKPDNIT